MKPALPHDPEEVAAIVAAIAAALRTADDGAVGSRRENRWVRDARVRATGVRAGWDAERLTR